MNSPSFEIVTVGGGLGASAFAGAMARKGVRVLVLEKETQFKDRVRGEYIVTWGVAEARELGIEGALLNSCGTAIPFCRDGLRASQPHRDDCPATGGSVVLSPGDAGNVAAGGGKRRR